MSGGSGRAADGGPAVLLGPLRKVPLLPGRGATVRWPPERVGNGTETPQPRVRMVMIGLPVKTSVDLVKRPTTSEQVQ